MTPEEKKLIKARKLVEAVNRLAKKQGLNFFIVTDGASGVSNNGNPAVRNAREAQIKWELEHGSDPYEDWGKEAEKKETYESGKGTVESYTPDRTEDHDEIVIKLKNGKKIVISNNTKVGLRVEPKSGDEIGYNGYRIQGTNVVHKVHNNKNQRGGWLEKVKAAAVYDKNKWPDFETYLKKHPDKAIELAEKLVAEHYKKQHPWGAKTKDGRFLTHEQIKNKTVGDVIIRGGDNILRQRRGMCHDLANARMKLLKDNGIDARRLFAYYGAGQDTDGLLGHSFVMFKGDDGKYHFASPGMRNTPRKNFGSFDDLKDAVEQYIGAIKDSGNIKDDDYIEIHDTTDIDVPDQIAYLDFVRKALKSKALYTQGK